MLTNCPHGISTDQEVPCWALDQRRFRLTAEAESNWVCRLLPTTSHFVLHHSPRRGQGLRVWWAEPACPPRGSGTSTRDERAGLQGARDSYHHHHSVPRPLRGPPTAQAVANICWDNFHREC